jgi:hypothetical protein
MKLNRIAVNFLLLVFIVLIDLLSAAAQTATAFRFPLDNWQEDCDFTDTCWKPNHLGDDAEATTDTLVYAPANGIVKEAKFHNGYGGTVIIEAFDGTEYVTIVLGHLRHLRPGDLLVSPGPVAIGTPVGRVAPKGENGGGYKPHLHIGIHKGQYFSSSYTCSGMSEWVYAGYTQCPNSVFNNWYNPSTYIQAHLLTNIVRAQATYNGTAFSGPINYNIVGPGGVIIGNAVPGETANLSPGQYTLVYQNGGPANSILTGITPSASQTLSNGGSIVFTMNFSAVTITPTGCTFRPDSGTHFSAIDYSTPTVFSTNQSGAAQFFQITVYSVDDLCNFEFAGTTSGNVPDSHRIGVKFNAPSDFDFWDFTTNTQLGGHQTGPMGSKGYLVNVLQTTDPSGQSVFSGSFRIE